MDEPAFVRGLQTSAGLRHDVNGALDRQTMAGFADEMIQRGARQQRHHEIRFFLAVFFELSNIEYLNDVGMTHGGENVALLVEQLERGRVGNVEDRLDRNLAAHNGIVSAVDEAHAALAEDLPDLIAACQFSG